MGKFGHILRNPVEAHPGNGHVWSWSHIDVFTTFAIYSPSISSFLLVIMSTNMWYSVYITHALEVLWGSSTFCAKASESTGGFKEVSLAMTLVCLERFQLFCILCIYTLVDLPLFEGRGSEWSGQVLVQCHNLIMGPHLLSMITRPYCRGTCPSTWTSTILTNVNDINICIPFVTWILYLTSICFYSICGNGFQCDNFPVAGNGRNHSLTQMEHGQEYWDWSTLGKYMVYYSLAFGVLRNKNILGMGNFFTLVSQSQQWHALLENFLGTIAKASWHAFSWSWFLQRIHERIFTWSKTRLTSASLVMMYVVSTPW